MPTPTHNPTPPRPRLGDPVARLAVIAELLDPCPVPDLAADVDTCDAHSEPWPCPTTSAAWLARGLHPAVEMAAAVTKALDSAMEVC